MRDIPPISISIFKNTVTPVHQDIQQIARLLQDYAMMASEPIAINALLTFVNAMVRFP